MADGRAEPKAASTWWVAPLFLVTGFGAVADTWYSALTDGTYYVTMSLVGPLIASLGLAMWILPELPRDGTSLSAMQRVRRYVGMAVLALGVVAGPAEFAFFNGWLPA